MKVFRAILILLLCLNLFQYNFWHLWVNMFYHLEYIQFTIFWLILHQVNDSWVKVIAKEGLLFCANDLIDMVYFDPQKVDINEYIFCLIGIIILVWQKTQTKRVS